MLVILISFNELIRGKLISQEISRCYVKVLRANRTFNFIAILIGAFIYALNKEILGCLILSLFKLIYISNVHFMVCEGYGFYN